MASRSDPTVPLPQRLTRQLLEIPETGMGFQVVDLVLTDGRVLPRVIVLNAEIAEIPDAAGAVDPALVLGVRPSAGGSTAG